jgi:alpha-1,2-mannosyltransferase
MSVAVGLLAAAVLGALFVHNLQTSPFVDFAAFYTAASDLRNGDPLYAPGLAWRDAAYSIDYPGKTQPTAALPYVYSPALAVALLPLTLLPFKAAAILWLILNYSLLIGSSFLLVRLLFPAQRRHWLVGALALSAILALFQPVRASLHWGQVDILILSLLALSLSDLAYGKDGRSGVWLALAIAIKPFLGVFVLFLLWKRSYRSVGTAAVTGGVLALISLISVGLDGMKDLLAVSAYFSSPTFAVNPGNQSPYGLLLRLFSANAYTVPILQVPWLVDGLRIALAAGVLGGFV